MPLPTPRKNEKETNFISRCVSFVIKEDPDLDAKSEKDRKQAVAMCYNQWRGKESLWQFLTGASKKLLESFQWALPILDSYNKNEAHWIKGIALTVGKSRNLTKYERSELLTAANTLIGKPLLVNHNKHKQVGDVDVVGFEDDQIEYIARVTDESYWKKILNGTITHVSPLGRPKYWELTAQDRLRREQTGARAGTPRRIVFDELSLVEPPEQAGVLDTTITVMENLKVMETVGDLIMGTKFKGRIKVE